LPIDVTFYKIEKENPQLPLLLVYLQTKEISQLTKSGVHATSSLMAFFFSQKQKLKSKT
jgi:hypothetical protein